MKSDSTGRPPINRPINVASETDLSKKDKVPTEPDYEAPFTSDGKVSSDRTGRDYEAPFTDKLAESDYVVPFSSKDTKKDGTVYEEIDEKDPEPKYESIDGNDSDYDSVLGAEDDDKSLSDESIYSEVGPAGEVASPPPVSESLLRPGSPGYKPVPPRQGVAESPYVVPFSQQRKLDLGGATVDSSDDDEVYEEIDEKDPEPKPEPAKRGFSFTIGVQNSFFARLVKYLIGIFSDSEKKDDAKVVTAVQDARPESAGSRDGKQDEKSTETTQSLAAEKTVAESGKPATSVQARRVIHVAPAAPENTIDTTKDDRWTTKVNSKSSLKQGGGPRT